MGEGVPQPFHRPFRVGVYPGKGLFEEAWAQRMKMCSVGLFWVPWEAYGAFQASFNNPFRSFWAYRASSSKPFRGYRASQVSFNSPFRGFSASNGFKRHPMGFQPPLTSEMNSKTEFRGGHVPPPSSAGFSRIGSGNHRGGPLKGPKILGGGR